MTKVYEVDCYGYHAAMCHAEELRKTGLYKRVVQRWNIVTAYA